MNADNINLLTEKIIGAALEVSNTLGAGFPEKLYERALLKELELRGIQATAQASFDVTYKGHRIGEYFSDFLVEDTLLIEMKCVERLLSEHSAPCYNYLRASGLSLCLLFNFQNPKLACKRIVHEFPA